MWQDALGDIDVQFKNSDIINGRKWMQRLTSKLFEAQSAMSRHRFKLIKRMGSPLFERPGGMPLGIKKRILQVHEQAMSNKKKKRRNVKYRSPDEKDLEDRILLQPQAKKRKVIEAKGEKRSRQGTAKDSTQPVVNTSNEMVDEIVQSSAQLSTNSNKRKNTECLPAQPSKKKAASRSFSAQDTSTTPIERKKREPTKKLSIRKLIHLGPPGIPDTEAKIGRQMQCRHKQGNKRGGILAK